MKKLWDDPVWKFFLAYIAGVAVLILLAMLFSGCKLTRDVSKNSTDSSSVKTDETKYTKKDTTSNTKESDRITFVYPVDTTVNNYYTYPSTVIYEKIKEDNTSSGSENFSNKKTDTVYVSTDNKNIQSSTKLGPSTFEWILIGFAGLIVLRLLKKWEIL